MNTSKKDDIKNKRRADRTRSYPSGKKAVITERSLKWADALQDGAQTLGYLHRVTKELKLCTTKNRAQDHLTDLFHEYPTTYFNGKNIGGRFINRPRRQFRTNDARYQELVYENSDRAVEILKEVGRYRENSPRYGGPWEHRYMGSCIYNSIKINANEAPNFRFISQHEVMERAGISSLAVRVPFKHPKTGELVKVWSKKYQKMVTPIWIPDGVLGLERIDPDGTKSMVLIILQACRSTEGMRCFDFEKKSFLRDYLQQKVFLSTGMYKSFSTYKMPRRLWRMFQLVQLELIP